MKRISLLFSAVYLLAGAMIAPVAAFAQNAPFMIIRFNQQRMYYEQPLYNAVSKAVSLKPEVMFDVVAIVPQTGNGSQDAAWQERSNANVARVVASLNAMGVPRSRLNISAQKQNGPRFDEVHISAK